ncbi:MAG: hypothetical protein EOO98_04370 [Pedobacter sp.]|nr:MAG: hypothetical protein EOO98_04370 [Pedobacter sp.]
MDGIALQWSAIEKLIFRFAFLLLTLFMFFFNNGTFPMFYFIAKLQNHFLHQFIPWLGRKVFHLPYDITVFTNGSGDTTYDYIVLSCVATISLIGALIWSVLDTKRLNYNRLYYWLNVGVRFYVGLMLINYGLVKVVQLQFPAPNFWRMMTTYGESSPMGLAWTFLGFSKGYNLFMGIAELMASLLFFRRTITIGAIITLMTTANVMAVNYFYDVPVKIISTALVVMCLFLLAPNFNRLIKLFFMGEPTVLRMLDAPIVNKRWKKITKYTLKYLLIGFMIFGGISNIYRGYKMYGAGSPKSPLYGAYKVDSFMRNGELITTSDTTKTRWDALVMQGLEHGAIKNLDTLEYVNIVTDTIAKKIQFGFTNDPNMKYKLNYQLRGNRLFLNGILFSDTVNISLTKMKFELVDRKLNWINEHPYNR